jgi:uncharacterized membrane protein
MSQLRDEILNWTATGRLRPGDAPRAFEIGGLTPQLSDWRTFLQTLLLWTGSVLVAAGVIFFFAYNWQSMQRFGKFALAETIFAAALIAAWRLGTGRPAGIAALCGAVLLTGALLALVGQIYQTGADTYELFAYWAALILPWVIAARFAPLWLMWIGLINLSVTYFQPLAWGTLWASFGIDIVAMAVWELGLVDGIPWLNRWGVRLLATLSGSLATIIGVLCVMGPGPPEVGKWAILAYIAWILAMYIYYRFHVFDVFMLAGTLLSAIVIVTAFLVKLLLIRVDAGGFLLVGFGVIGMSGAGAWWIRQMIRDRPA